MKDYAAHVKFHEEFESQSGSQNLKLSNNNIEWRRTLARDFFFKGMDFIRKQKHNREDFDTITKVIEDVMRGAYDHPATTIIMHLENHGYNIIKTKDSIHEESVQRKSNLL